MAIEWEIPPVTEPVPVKIRERKSKTILWTEYGKPYSVQAFYERQYLDADNAVIKTDTSEDEVFTLTPEFLEKYPEAGQIAAQVSAFIDKVRQDRRDASQEV